MYFFCIFMIFIATSYLTVIDKPEININCYLFIFSVLTLT